MSIPSNIYTIIKALRERGITNVYSIGAILGIVYKESGFKLATAGEYSYRNTSNARIKSIFSKTQSLTDAQLTELKKDDYKFFNFVYGGRFGNGADEGYKYRGRGFNGLTFKNNYQIYQDILKLPLVNNPDLVNTVDVAAKVVAAYYLKSFQTHKALYKSRYGVDDINGFKDIKTAYEAMFNATAGMGKDTRNISDPTGGKQRGFNQIESLMKYVLDNKTTIGISAGVILMVTGFFF